MILLELFIGFLRVGCFAFGGAYGAIPLIRDVVLSYGWLDDEMLTDHGKPGDIGRQLAGRNPRSTDCDNRCCPSIVYHYSAGNSASENRAGEPLCTGGPSRTEAEHDRYHSCYGCIHDHQERNRYSGKGNIDSSFDTDFDAGIDLFRLQKNQ